MPSMGKGIGLPSLVGSQFQNMGDSTHDAVGDAGGMIGGLNSQSGKSESKKHPSLPKEVRK